MFCQDVQQLYLKRKGLVYGERLWAMITYGKYDESDSRTYSIELEECHENDVPDMLDKFEVGNEVNFVDLEEMGWQGKVSYSATVKSMFHSCYDGLQFPSFASPLKRNQFGGSDGFVWMNLQSFDGQKIKARPVRLHKDAPQELIAQLHCERADRL
jgi:hypothetical protein